jgi:hypothetical protein
MKRSVGYRALFDEDNRVHSTGLAHELEDILAVHRAPEAYRTALRAKLLAAAGDESNYRRSVRTHLLVAMAVVVTLGLSVAGLIAWRNFNHSLHQAGAQ